MNPLDKLLAAAAKIAQAADSVPDVKARIALKESVASIRGTVATIRAAAEKAAEKPSRGPKFGTVLGDESPLPGAQKPLCRREKG
jgi:hypothetical protein